MSFRFCELLPIAWRLLYLYPDRAYCEANLNVICAQYLVCTRPEPPIAKGVLMSASEDRTLTAYESKPLSENKSLQKSFWLDFRAMRKTSTGFGDSSPNTRVSPGRVERMHNNFQKASLDCLTGTRYKRQSLSCCCPLIYINAQIQQYPGFLSYHYWRKTRQRTPRSSRKTK